MAFFEEKKFLGKGGIRGRNMFFLLQKMRILAVRTEGKWVEFQKRPSYFSFEKGTESREHLFIFDEALSWNYIFWGKGMERAEHTMFYEKSGENKEI